MTYYKLRCVPCGEDYAPLRATEPGDMLYPNYEECAQNAGLHNAERLEAFHNKHSGPEHKLVEVVVEGESIGILGVPRRK